MKRCRYACVAAVLIGLLGGASVATANEFLRQMRALRRDSRELISQERYEEAITLYVEAGRQTDDPRLQAHCMGKAAEIVMARLDDVPRALTLARAIEDEQRAASRELQVLVEAEHFEAAVDRFGDVDISKWPDDRQGISYKSRAIAYLELDMHEQARDELETVSRLPGQRPHLMVWVCYRLGKLYEEAFDDRDNALAAYTRGVEATRATYAWRNRCFLGRARILLERDEAQSVLASFEEVDYAGLSSDYWRGAFYVQHAKVHEQLGNFGQAAQVLTKALRLPDKSEGFRELIRERIERLVSEM